MRATRPEPGRGLSSRARRMLAVGAAAAAIAVALYAKSVYEENALPPGPPAVAGRILVERKRCIRCHKIAGEGGLVGPDLTLVATRKGEAFMVSYLSDPRAVDPNGKMPKPRLTEEQRQAVVAYLRTLDGKHPIVPAESGGR